MSGKRIIEGLQQAVEHAKAVNAGQHTPGSRRLAVANEHHVIVDTPEGGIRKIVASAATSPTLFSPAEWRANARLIAMSPALLETLKRVIEAAERALGDHVAPNDCFATGPLTGNPIADLIVCPGCVQMNEIAAARAIIAKAEGHS